jgi:hypothetical protein
VLTHIAIIFPNGCNCFIVLYPQKTELVNTAKLPLGDGMGSIVHLRESDKGTICSPNSNFIAFPIIYIYIYS